LIGDEALFMSYSWVKEVLSRSYPNTDWQAGVDLDQSGQVEEVEKLTDLVGEISHPQSVRLGKTGLIFRPRASIQPLAK
jgi:hypothetical protein